MPQNPPPVCQFCSWTTRWDGGSSWWLRFWVSVHWVLREIQPQKPRIQICYARSLAPVRIIRLITLTLTLTPMNNPNAGVRYRVQRGRCLQRSVVRGQIPQCKMHHNARTEKIEQEQWRTGVFQAETYSGGWYGNLNTCTFKDCTSFLSYRFLVWEMVPALRSSSTQQDNWPVAGMVPALHSPWGMKIREKELIFMHPHSALCMLGKFIAAGMWCK